MAETQKLNFRSAMNDFKNMFPHLEDSLIEQVLRRNNGMVDQTIDDLLAISCVEEEQPSNNAAGPSNIITNQNELLARPAQPGPPASSGAYPTLSAHLPPGDLTLTPRSQQPPYQKYGQVPVSFLGTQFKIPYTDPLPHQFLRLSESPSPAANSTLAAQMAEDREFALLLHNQDLLQEMQSNQEFMRTLSQAERSAFSAAATTAAQESSSSSSGAGASSSRRTDEVTIAQRLQETGRATRSKLLKIARKLDFRRSSAAGYLTSGKSSHQPLLEEDDEDEGRLPMLEDKGDDGGILFSDMEETEEELKTIPRQNTLQEFEANRQRAREVVARQFRGERPPPPPIPPPNCPSSTSTMSQEDFFSASGTLTNSRNNSEPAYEPALLDLNDDNIYEDPPTSSAAAGAPASPRPASPIYTSTDETQDTVSNMTMSETSSLYDCDTFRNREIHSATLSSSYLIPIRTIPDDEAERYDNLNCNVRAKEENLIKF